MNRSGLMHRRAVLVLSAAVLAMGLALGSAGCLVLTFQKFKADAVTPYDGFFDDLATPLDHPQWVWVRGVVTGDFDGDSQAKEEAIVATIQSGDKRTPGPVEKAYLLFCAVDNDDKRTVMSRHLIFDKSPIAEADRPDWVLTPDFSEVPIFNISAQAVADRVKVADTVVIIAWGERLPGPIWYGGYSLHDGEFHQELDIAAWQAAPGLMVRNIDRRGVAENRGRQLVVRQDVLPPVLATALGDKSATPLWGNIYTRDENGIFYQADDTFGSEYSLVQAEWLRTYEKAKLLNVPPEDLAIIEFYVGLLHSHIRDISLAEGFLRLAADHAGTSNDKLSAAIDSALKQLDELKDSVDDGRQVE